MVPICLVSKSCPSPTPGIPALLLTTVKFVRSDRSRKALMRVFGTPEKPKPPTSSVESDFMSLMASCAEETILLIAGRDALAEKKRMPVAGPRRRAEKSRDLCIAEGFCRCTVRNELMLVSGCSIRPIFVQVLSTCWRCGGFTGLQHKGIYVRHSDRLQCPSQSSTFTDNVEMVVVRNLVRR